MITKAQQARANLAEARELRAAGLTYRQVGRRLKLTSSQLCRIRKTLKREKAALARLRRTGAAPSARDLGVGACDLPPDLRRRLAGAGYRTVGDLADRLLDRELPGLDTIAGIGPSRAAMVRDMIGRLGLLPEPEDLQAEIEALFPEFAR